MQKIDTSKRMSEIVRDMLRDDGTAKMMLSRKAEVLWQSVMGPTVNRATLNVRVRDGIMYVALSSSVVRQELFNLKWKIVAAINKAVGEEVVKDIRFS